MKETAGVLETEMGKDHWDLRSGGLTEREGVTEGINNLTEYSSARQTTCAIRSKGPRNTMIMTLLTTSRNAVHLACACGVLIGWQ